MIRQSHHSKGKFKIGRVKGSDDSDMLPSDHVLLHDSPFDRRFQSVDIPTSGQSLYAFWGSSRKSPLEGPNMIVRGQSLPSPLKVPCFSKKSVFNPV